MRATVLYGAVPTRAYIEELLPDVLEGSTGCRTATGP